ncbi:MAG: LysR family transcriptional regulator [Acidocella sp. 20-57-95]|nr:MAG: LysR family transcriptional regulator [Acidocella sp. 20-57-95]HQT63809.1 LysR family transcriptional regulator ArgP [Acidocella sp.]HQU05082.1 LysR family transcriptional regulator ArgP [Acidocella sp.]
MFDYQSLAALAAIVRDGSFERAATSLGVTASAVSQRLRALEERMGTVLVVRGQPCTPTEAGARLCAHVEQVRLLEGEMAGSLPSLAAGVPAPLTIRIAVNADSLGAWLMPAIAAFAEKTGVLLDLVLDDEEHTAGRLRTGEVLAAVTADPEPVQGCRSIPLGTMSYIAAASPGYAQRYFPRGVDAECLGQAPVLRFNHKDRLQARWVRQTLGEELDAPTHWVPSTQGFIDAALAGLGWGMSPLALVAGHLQAGRLVNLWPGRSLDIPLYWQHVRIGKRLLEGLTREVLLAARPVLRAGLRV